MAAFDTPFAEPVLACGNCRAPMRRLTLPSHYGLPVDIDLCAGCHLLWFDTTESVRLGGAAVLALIAAMAQAQGLPHTALSKGVRCPRCTAALETVHNQTRWGRLVQLECANRHGAIQPFGQFLQGKGLLRPMSLPDRHRLLQAAGRIDCVNCGGAIGLHDAECPYCLSVPSLLDVARLAHALDPEGAIRPQAVHATEPRPGALQCGACGAALPPGEHLSCAHCGATLAVSCLADVQARVGELGAALQAHADRPAPEVVKRRLEALQGDVPRRREWIADMQASARPNERIDEDFDWSSLFRRGTNPVRAVLVALVIWFAWSYWARR